MANCAHTPLRLSGAVQSGVRLIDLRSDQRSDGLEKDSTTVGTQCTSPAIVTTGGYSIDILITHCQLALATSGACAALGIVPLAVAGAYAAGAVGSIAFVIFEMRHHAQK